MFGTARRFLLTLFTVLSLLGISVMAIAQTRPATPAPAAAGATTGRIAGKATEKGKDPVSYANVVVLGTKQGTQTDENGAFIIAGVPVGTYQVKLQAIGYDPVIQQVQV
ncbi:MAG: carboxypeptidase-like regulatory domain-containing protein, partial [Candidatus Eisenbacteria bacterium]